MAEYTTTFDDPAENPLSEGGAWASFLSYDLQKAGGECAAIVSTGPSGMIIPTSYATYSADQKVEFTLSAFLIGDRPGAILRGSGTDYYLIDPTDVDNFRVRRYNAGTPTTIVASATTDTTIAGTDTFLFTVEDSGANAIIYGYQNGSGTPFLTYTDTSRLNGGQPGLYYEYTDSLTTRFTSATLGDLAAAASITAVDSPVLDAETGNTITTTGFASEITDIDIYTNEDVAHNLVVAYTGSSGSYLFDMPDVANLLVDTIGTPFDSTYWSHVIEVTDGTDTDTEVIVVNPQAGWTRVDVSETPSVAEGSVFENFVGFLDDITAVSVANPSQLTLADTSGWTDGQEVTLAGFTTTPDINGTQVITIVDSTHVSIPVNVTAVTDGVGTMLTGAASEHGQVYFPNHSSSTDITSEGILTTDQTSNFGCQYFDCVDSEWKAFTVVVAEIGEVSGMTLGIYLNSGMRL